MSEFWTSAVLWLAQISVVASCLILLTLLLARFTRQPAKRQRLCEVGLAAALLAAAVSAAPAWLVIGLPIKAQESPAADSASVPEELLDLGLDPVLVADPRQALLQEVAMPESEPQAAPADPETISLGAAVGFGFLALYGAGTLFFLVRWLKGLLVLRRLLRQTEPVPPHVLELLGIGPEGRPRLLVSRRLRVPISCGVLRPTVVLPIAFCQPRAHARLRCIFAHELTHIERRDALSALLFVLGQAVFFHLPWFWMLRKQVRLCQEYVADASAVAERPADEYAEFLLTLTETKALPLFTTGVGGPVSDLFRRVSMLLQNPLRVEKRCPRFWTWGLACVFLALATMLGGVGLRAAAADTIIIIIPGKSSEPAKDKTADTKNYPQDVPIGYLKTILLNDKGMIVKEPANTPLDPTNAIRVHAVQALASLQEVKKLPPPTKADQEKMKKVIQDLENTLKARPDSKELRDLIDRLKALKGLSSNEKLQNLYQLAYPQDPKKTLYQQGVLPYGQAYPAVDTKKYVPSLGPGPQGVIPGHPAPWLEYQYPYKTDPGNRSQVDWKKLEKLLEQIQKAPDKVDPKEIRKALEEIRKASGNAPYWVPVQQSNDIGFFPAAQALIVRKPDPIIKPGTRGRFGIRLSAPSNDLRDYLGLPKNQGLMIDEVDVNSPAAKAGLKVRDIVLKLNNQPLPSDTNKAAKMFADVKDGTSVNLTILRKGKEEVIKGIVPTAPDVQWIRQTVRQSRLIGEFQKVPEKGALVTILSDAGKFTATHREKQLTITIKGILKDGKTSNLDILIQVEGKEAFHGGDLKSVPEAWRQRVLRLFELARGWQTSPRSGVPEPRTREFGH